MIQYCIIHIIHIIYNHIQYYTIIQHNYCVLYNDTILYTYIVPAPIQPFQPQPQPIQRPFQRQPVERFQLKQCMLPLFSPP